PSPVESTLKDGTLPSASPQDTAALDRDYHAAVTAGEALDQSTPDLDLEDDIADAADAYLDGELLPAAARSAPSEASAKDGPASRFYSALARAIESKMPARSTPSTVVGILKNAGIKTEELKWTGILPWLQQQAQGGLITQQQVLDYLKDEGAVHLQEVRLGGSQTSLEDANRAVIAQAQAEGMTQSGAEDYALTAARGDLSPGQQSLISPAMRPLVARLRASYEARAAEYAAGQSQPKYSQYQLPNGTNYREVVLSMPEEKDAPPDIAVERNGDSFDLIVDGEEVGNFDTREEAQTEADKRREQWTFSAPTNYTSSHFPAIPNYVAHMRLNDRTDATGHPGTFIEEIQSDRHQQGREKGYIPSPDELARLDELNERRESLTGSELSEWEKLAELQDKFAMGGNTGVPDAPFRTSWPLQMFKRALADSVASGKQWIGWTTGDTQTERYDLSQHIDTISYTKTGEDKYTLSASKDNISAFEEEGASIQRIAEVLGKEIAKKIEAGEGQFEEADEILDIPAHHKLSGVDLKVGGEGMKGFYDQILPKEIGKYVKQWGASVQRAPLSAGPSSAFTEAVKRSDAAIAQYGHGSPEATEAILAIPSDSGQDTTPIWRVDITPQMRAGVEAGQALFAAPRRAYESMTFDPPFHTPFGDILSYDWMNQPVGGLSSQRTSDWSRARTNPATGRDIVHHFKVQKPDGIHTVSLETALGQLTEPQRHKLQSLIKSEQRRREEAAAGQMTLFAGQRQRFDLSRALAPTTTQSGALTSLFNPRPGAPQNADPRRGYFPSTATPQLITQAYTAAAVGQSSAMLPIRRVFEQAQSLHPSLTPAAFLQTVKAADDSGQVLLEPYDTPAALEAAQPFVLRNASGIPCVSMAVTAALPAGQRVEAAAAATDPNPSAAQKAAGNYAKGKVTLHGLRLSIENPRGSIRSGTDATGKAWSVTMPHHYGYFLGTEGKDGDQVDFFLGPNPDSQLVLIVNQRKTQGAGL
ncbi:MAG TPA: hypothetical protein DCP71_13595, partial [Verrucomicrobiales bacterium]|nr:hypothetical protein [Verrucomicrobiales bacterium]